MPSEVRLPVDNPRQRCRDWTQARGLDNLHLHRLRTSRPGNVGRPLRWQVGLTAAGVSGTIHAHENDRENTMEMLMLVAIAAVIYEGLLGNIG